MTTGPGVLSAQVNWACGHTGVSTIGNVSLECSVELAREAIAAIQDGCRQVNCWLCRVEARRSGHISFRQPGLGLA